MLGEYYKERLILTDKANVKEANSLSLVISHNSLLFAISDKNFKNIQQLGHVELLNTGGGDKTFAEKIAFLLNNYQLAQKKFEKIIISILSKDFTIVPEAFSNSGDMKEFLAFSSGLTEVKNPLVHSIKNVKFCYVFDPELIQYLERTYTQAIIKHAGAINTDLFFSNHSLINCNLFLAINDGLIEIAAKEKNELLFYNVFNYENNEDVLYYLLFMMEQFNLNPLQIKLVISGQVQTNDPLILSIKKYIKQVSFVVHHSEIKPEGELSKLPQHHYFTLLNQHLCVS
ncbi:MAG: DUF3822 family protein [Bacteroidetes bacterium]|nr:DUF3822 family protein [Bacteroidota bacterium]